MNPPLTPIRRPHLQESMTVSKQRRILLLAAGVPLGLLLLLVAAWGIDATVSGDTVTRGVTLEGEPIAGLDRADLQALAADQDSDLGSRSVEVTMGNASVTTDARALGVRVDREQLVNEALTARRDGFFLARPFRWLGSFFTDHSIDVPYLIDETAANEAEEALIETALAKPIEPSLTQLDGAVVAVPGSDGETLDPGMLAAGLPSMMEAGAPYQLSLSPTILAPELDLAQLEAVAEEANAATARGLTIRVLDDAVALTPDQVRAWVTLDPLVTGDDSPTWTIDERRMLNDLNPAFPTLGDDQKQAHFEVVNGQPVIIPAAESLICCVEGSGDVVFEGLIAATEAPDPPEIGLDPMVTGGDAGAAALEELGIIEQVSTFTTNHKCCENRVTNIHLMADIVRGTVVRPGETFSLNGLVGERTPAKGFLPAGAIAQGVLEEQVGGGVSQFTTTIFNAAFFAGMELVEYQAHSLYFSRYPRGREATVSWPKPDFKFRNDTPYGILIWPTYNDTSITVTFYSTENVAVEDVGRTEKPQGACTRVTTTRQRTWNDGRIDTDTVFAVYRPSEGLDCNGNSTTPTTEAPPTTAAPTTAAPTTPPPTTPAPTTAVPTTAAPTTTGTTNA